MKLEKRKVFIFTHDLIKTQFKVNKNEVFMRDVNAYNVQV